MGAFFWILLIIVVLYGGLTIIAGFTGLKQDMIDTAPSFMMIIGGLLIILPSILKAVFGVFGLIMLILGLILIHISAIKNGFKVNGNINIKHHTVRLAISIVVIVLYLLK